MADSSNATLGATVKYNPHLWGKVELRAIFVARTRELEEIITRIRDTAQGRVPQHLLITGARGMGKSTLLHRIALAVSDDAELSLQWLPLILPEEQYTVSTLAELWFNVLGVLADTLEQEGTDARQLDRLGLEVARIKKQAPEGQEAEALALLTDWIKHSGRRVLLLIDSTHQLFGSLSSDGAKSSQTTGSTQLWRLRNTLSHCPELFWIGASYQALEVTQQYTDAFHDFFELIKLRPLTLGDMRNAMLALANTFGSGSGSGLRGEAAAAEMAHNLDARPERLKTLRAITGGNPRTTVILYDLFAAGWQDDLHSDLKALLDSMTPLYKARMENLAEQPRKILAHIMEYWAPVALGDLTQLSGIANTTLSGQLKRLEQEGLLEKVKLPGTRRSGYQASERLFNIWYLMRYTSRWVRQKLTWLIEFMRLWYSTEELRGLAQARAQVHSQGGLRDGSQLELSVAYSEALPAGCRERYMLEHSVFATVGQLDPQDPYPYANLARLAAQLGQIQRANDLYRQAAKLAAEQAEPAAGIAYQELLLQAHLWLNNQDAARLALESLAQTANTGNSLALLKLREQACEASVIGLGLALSELMAGFRYADFLQPMILALRDAENMPDALEGTAAEIKTMVAEVLADIMAYRKSQSITA